MIEYNTIQSGLCELRIVTNHSLFIRILTSTLLNNVGGRLCGTGFILPVLYV
jgi:hypothetical protein